MALPADDRLKAVQLQNDAERVRANSGQVVNKLANTGMATLGSRFNQLRQGTPQAGFNAAPPKSPLPAQQPAAKPKLSLVPTANAAPPPAQPAAPVNKLASVGPSPSLMPSHSTAAPGPPKPATFQPGAGEGMMRNEQTGETATFRNGQVSMTDAQGNPIQRAVGRLGRVNGQPAASNGYSINVTDQMTPEAVAALQAPSQNRLAGIDQDIQDRYDRLHQEQYMQRITGGGFAPIHSQPSGRYFGPTPLPQESKGDGMPELLTRENSTMGWKSRQAVNDRLLEIWGQGKRDAAAMDREVTGNRLAGQNQLNVARENIEANRGLTEAQTENFSADAQDKQISNTRQRHIADIQQRLDDPNLDAEERRQLENLLYAAQGKQQQEYQLTTRKDVGENGMPIETPFIIDAEGNERVVGEGGGQPSSPASPEALEYLKQHPENAAFFKKKYGYLPPGFEG